MKRANRLSPGEACVSLPGFCECSLVAFDNNGVQLRIDALNTFDVRLDRLGGRNVAASNGTRFASAIA